MKRIFKLLAATSLGAVLAVSVAYTPDYFEISKQLDIFTNVFKEVNLYYVDDTEPGELMTEAIESMLSSLDPYTNYIPEERVEDFKIQTTGNYGGIGAAIRKHNGQIILTTPYEGFAADKAGIKAGDRIIRINGEEVSSRSVSEISHILKGAPGTTVELQLERDGQKFTQTVEREEVQVKSVPYYAVLQDNIAYISLSSFTEKASREIKAALEDMRENHEVKGVVLDLRGNPGGLLSEAVNVSNIFVDKGKVVVKTKGKMEEWEKTYKTLNSAEDTKTPVAVLIDKGSASASEIVAGTLQDYDRGVVIGQRSFGKGLVQQTRKLSYGSQLKVTIAKYYTPSGRGIQAINYAERAEDGSVKKIPDSLRTRFQTEAGRVVYDGGGIDPDVIVEQPQIDHAIMALYRDMFIFNYATKYAREHDSIAPADQFRLSDNEYGEFLSWLKEQEGFNYETDTEKFLQRLEASANKEGYASNMDSELAALKVKYQKLEANDLEEHREEIKQLLEEEIASRYYYDSGRIANGLQTDREVVRALEVLKNNSQYDSILATTASK